MQRRRTSFEFHQCGNPAISGLVKNYWMEWCARNVVAGLDCPSGGRVEKVSIGELLGEARRL
jgi:hypothetical protein